MTKQQFLIILDTVPDDAEVVMCDPDMNTHPVLGAIYATQSGNLLLQVYVRPKNSQYEDKEKSMDTASKLDEYYRILTKIDESPFEVTKWESEFIEHLLSDRPGWLSTRQRELIEDMAKKYLVE
jgi:hypothetical protein